MRRKVKDIFHGMPVVEGAGVHLRRVFGYHETPLFDPFLMLDDFRSDEPEKFIQGFPWHPHRGIETITYVTKGDVEHGDSMGNSGVISGGDVQWMTAGSGIIHQEMPKGAPDGGMYGFQLWANLPASDKMMAPRYRGITASEIPTVTRDDGVSIQVISGTVDGVSGPMEEIVIEPEYLDCHVPEGVEFVHPAQTGKTAFIYVTEGTGQTDGKPISNRTAVLYQDGDELAVTATGGPVRFLLITGKPLGEPIAWRGPIVMNTSEELNIAFHEYAQGTFIKTKVSM